MLVLTRKAEETIHIGEDVVLKVIRTGSGSVKIGIDAPKTVRVIRGELLEAAVAEPADAGNSTPWIYSGVQSDQFPHVA